jgi:hypothetical protein
MGVKESFRKICESLGKNNKPTYAVMAIATVKGIARPTFTMMDKTENPETKKYTAIREGLTEVIAIPTYWACGELTSKLAKKMNLAEDKLAAAEHNLMFAGVCAAALIIIPAVTSLTIKPLMKKLKQRNAKKNEENKLDITDKAQVVEVKQAISKPQKTSSNIAKMNYMPVKIGDMKVGGLW